jgi:hypothetical protein
MCHNARVAKWHIFKPKIPIWVIMEGLAMDDVRIFYSIWSIIQPFNTYFVAIWYIFPDLVSSTKKNLATLHNTVSDLYHNTCSQFFCHEI